MNIQIIKSLQTDNSNYEEYSFDVNRFALRDIIKESLIRKFGSETLCLNYWGNYNLTKLDDIINHILYLRDLQKIDNTWNGEYLITKEDKIKIYYNGSAFLM